MIGRRERGRRQLFLLARWKNEKLKFYLCTPYHCLMPAAGAFGLGEGYQ